MLVVEPLWCYAVHGWEADDEAVYARSGWVVCEWRIAPIFRIQTVDTVRGPAAAARALQPVGDDGVRPRADRDRWA